MIYMLMPSEVELHKRFNKMLGQPHGLLAATRIAQRIVGKTGIEFSQACVIVEEMYKSVLEEFMAQGILRLPWGLTVVQAKRVKQRIKERYRCSNPTLQLPEKIEKHNPPFVYFQSAVILTLMALEIENELLNEGVTKNDLKKCIFGTF